MKDLSRRTPAFWPALLAIFAAGAALRLYAISSQILVDDEWHSIIQSIGRNYVQALTQFNPHDNSSPLLAVYNVALYRAGGWTELTLRLPVILTGLASLLVLPWLVQTLFNARVALFFAGLLAIAPFLVFYSRYARTYGLAMAFGFAALLWFQQWLTTGQRRYAAGFVAAGALAVYAHLLALAVIFAPLAATAGWLWLGRFQAQPPTGSAQARERADIAVSLKGLVVAGVVLVVLLLPLLVPVLRASSRLPWHKGNLTSEGVATAATLASGTANVPLNAAFFLLGIAGLRLLFRQNRVLGWIFGSAVAASCSVVLLSRPEGLEKGAVLMRYLIVTVPMVLMLVALALERLTVELSRLKQLHAGAPVALVVLFMGTLYAAGPLPAEHGAANNFTDHSAFQANYEAPEWDSSSPNSILPSHSVNEAQIPPFYRWLAGQTNVSTVIEYPFDICDYNDMLYYYQHFHGKEVVAGYCADATLVGYGVPQAPPAGSAPYTIGMLNADDFLVRVREPEKLKFRNMVNVGDTAAVADGPAEMIILHKSEMALKIMPDPAGGGTTYGSIRIYYLAVRDLKARYQQVFGPPAYEDEQMVCFWTKAPPASRERIYSSTRRQRH